MAGAQPRKLILDYGGGETVAVDFADLPLNLGEEILRQPFAARPSPDPAAEKYVLVEWKDGWKEVYQVDRSCTAINRFYVISRLEESGRLSLHTESGYPQLLEIGRRPMGVERVTFGEVHEAVLARSEREGKKTDHWFELRAVGDGRPALAEAARLAAATAGLRVVAGRRQQDLLDFVAAMGEEG